MAACSAQIGSVSVIITLAPLCLKDAALPLPTSPKPATIATFPDIITSVALLIPSTKLSLHPYKLSNFDFVTESFTFIAGTIRVPCSSIFLRAKTPVVVSSLKPFTSFNNSLYSLCIRAVKSPPSSNIILGFQSFLPSIVCFTHHQYSSSVSPFQANTGIPAFAIAAAA